jgi:hypothetical protein
MTGNTGVAMDNNEERVDEFKNEIAQMRIRPPEDANERVWLIAGLVLPLLGILAIFLGWWGASGSAYPAEQLPYVISGGLLGIGLIVAGAALFVRYSMTRYMRFWLLRVIYEERAQTDRAVASLEEIEKLLRSATRPRSKS